MVFAAGFLLGVLTLYYVLWRTGGITAGHFASLTTSDIAGATRGSPPPLATIPFPATPAPGSIPPILTTSPTTASLEASATTPATPLVSLYLTPTPTPVVRFFGTLEGRTLDMPVVGARTMDLRDSFEEARGGTRHHEAIDILAPRGTPVIAVDEGKIAKLFTSKQGGLTVYQFDGDASHAFYYAHLDRYANGLAEGKYLRRGDPIGAVGTTGNAPPDTPHLHFAIFELGPEKNWWQGKPINPYPFLMKVK